MESYFEHIYAKKEISEALELFREHHPQVVIIDIEMANFKWSEITAHIRDVSPETRIIILSKHDGQQFLYDSIDAGVTKFLKQPVDKSNFSIAIKLALSQINYSNDTKIFYTYLRGLFNYQKSMVVMVENKEPFLANQMFLNFFGVESVREFVEKYKNIGTKFNRTL